MLKIREDVDLKELEKYGFVILYNEYTGEPDKLYQRWGYPFCDSADTPFIKFVKMKQKKKTKILYKNIKASYGMSVSYPQNKRNEEIFLDTIYDLIKADLVEKVEEQ